MGTNGMRSMQLRYGRPKTNELDDTQQLESLAALLIANPSLKPTTAIRALGVENPSDIRRLRDKFRLDQARLMAIARHSVHLSGRTLVRPGSLSPARRRALTSLRNNVPAAPAMAPDTNIAVDTARVLPQPPLPAIVCDFGLWAMTTAIEQHAVLARHWLRLPAVEIALRNQLAVGAFLVAVSGPRKPLKPHIH